MALDAILKLSDREPESGWVAIAAPWRDRSKDEVFKPIFSPRLLAAWRKAEQNAVKENCNGVYIDGEMCGIDIHPITCSQDSHETYVYQTLSSSVTKAVIEYRWPEHPKAIATYRLVREERIWVLDGVSCSGYLKFNMP